jgi:peptide methionine sulfoxide reductase MsrB
MEPHILYHSIESRKNIIKNCQKVEIITAFCKKHILHVYLQNPKGPKSKQLYDFAAVSPCTTPPL